MQKPSTKPHHTGYEIWAYNGGESRELVMTRGSESADEIESEFERLQENDCGPLLYETYFSRKPITPDKL